MDSTLWPRRPLPAIDGHAATWDLTSVAELPGVRAALREIVAARAGDGDDVPSIDPLLLAFDELVSNGLRHGSGPVRARLVFCEDGWLIDVSDHATGRPPEPAVGRDPARGGLGLYLIARLTTAHGWTVDAGRKHVWARLDPSRALVPSAG